jgi:hypothetical protein
MPAQMTRAQRDREIATLEKSVAYLAARTYVECYFGTDRDANGLWYDTTRLTDVFETPDDAQFVYDGLRYLELRKLLTQHPTHPHRVQIKDWL